MEFICLGLIGSLIGMISMNDNNHKMIGGNGSKDPQEEFFIAIDRGDVETVSQLIDTIIIDKVSRYGDTSLIMALRGENQSIIDLLMTKITANVDS